jgi:dTDP-4-amino-4,6-dideoxygalactose transaminase
MKIPFLDLAGLHSDLASDVLESWRDLIDRSAFIGGAHVERFEHNWSTYCGVRHAIGVANGTDALELILMALAIGPGDEVVVPANTFVATAEAVVAVGARPRFVDVDPRTLLITADAVRAAIGPRTAAVMAVHLYGAMADMVGITEVCDQAGVALIEDAAQAHGADHHGRRAGAWGIAAGFSFYPGKNLGAFGDAGAVTTNDPHLAQRIRSLRDHGRADDDKHLHQLSGRNSRLDGIQAVVLDRKLEELDEWNRQRAAAAARYRRLLPSAAIVPAVPLGTTSVHHLMVVEVPRRNEVLKGLTDRGVGVGIHYPVPCHRQNAFRRFSDGPLPNCQRAAARLLSLPMHPLLTDDEIAFVCSCVGELLEMEDRSDR